MGEPIKFPSQSQICKKEREKKFLKNLNQLRKILKELQKNKEKNLSRIFVVDK